MSSALRCLVVSAVVLFCHGCLRRGIDVDVTIGFDECFTAAPMCMADDAGTELSCVAPSGETADGCYPACLLGLNRIESCPLEGQCFNVVAGQLLETPVICTRF